MKPEAFLEVANKSRRQAEFYLQKGNTGRAFAHFLVALKLCPSWKTELSQQFVTTLCVWGEELDKQQRHKDLFNCYEQALETFPDNEEVLNNLGFHLYRWGHTLEACNYFRKAVACNPAYLPAKRNLQGCCNLLVERWHYRMLNDSVRNDAYRAAITRRMSQLGPATSVLDIGTGTGLLSLFAVEAGAQKVFACDYSPAMIQIASQVLEANGAADKVTLINKMSNDIVIPTDMPARVQLVVTETVDAGLLGEGILQSLIHAWEHLIQSDASDVMKVVPESASVWIVPIECLHIARKYRALLTCKMQTRDDFDFDKLHFTSTRDEPYDTEDLTTIPGGYRILARPQKALNINFNDYNDMSSWLKGQKVALSFECIEPGQVDAFVAWFNLKLDDTIILSSTPYAESDEDDFCKASCWDQAVFPVQNPVFLRQNDKMEITVSCHEGKITVNMFDYDMETLEKAFCSSKISAERLCEQSSSFIVNEHEEVLVNVDSKGMGKKKEMVSDMEVDAVASEGVNDISISRTQLSAIVSQEAVRFINDEFWMKGLKETAKHLCEERKNSNLCSVLDLCPFPVLGLHLLKMQDIMVTCLCSSPGDEAVIKKLAQMNGVSPDKIQCVDKDHLSEFLQHCKPQFDVIMVHPIHETGELREDILNILPVLRSMLLNGGIMLPRHISVWGQLLESDWLGRVSRVQNNYCTCGFNIASFINVFQVSEHLDLNLSGLPAVPLSDFSELLHIDLAAATNHITQSAAIRTAHRGKVNALAYWYHIDIHAGVDTISTFHDSSHVSQAAILFHSHISVHERQNVNLFIRFHEGAIYVDSIHEDRS